MAGAIPSRIAPIHIRLDSSAPRSPWNGRFSQPDAILQCDSRTLIATISDARGRIISRWQDPLEALKSLPGEDAGASRWVGFLSYDLGRCFEKLPSIASDDLGLPLFRFTRHPPRAAGTDQPAPPQSTGSSALRCNFTPQRYLDAVRRALEYIRAGDIFQVNLSQRFSAALPAQPAEIYRRLLERSPARYGALLEYPDFAMVCNSPELFLRITPHADKERTIMTRPIKGTRPLAPGMDQALLASAKDQAELNMIIDLERNDLGRICRIGSVKVAQHRAIEAHPTVYHGVATIEGALRPDVGLVDVLRAAFPGGSITGAPKIRAMEIIESLEPQRRGPYCGAIGYLCGDGSMEFNIAIRTMIAADGLIHIPVGGGIVADSVPQEEFEETLVKARAMFAACGFDGAQLPRS